MEESSTAQRPLAAASKLFARRLLTIGENRLELLTVELQEERERLLHALLLAFGAVACALLAAITFTATVVVLLWAYSHIAALLILTVLYGVAAAVLYRRLTELLRDWQTLPDSLDQLRKDRASLEKILA
jgi:uncharacterized membrane protein YqjE